MAIERRSIWKRCIPICLASCGVAQNSADDATSEGAVRVDARTLVASATPQQVMGRAPRDGSQSFEVIRSFDRLEEVITAMEAEGNGPIAAGEDGSPWPSRIDFDDFVVGWISLGFHSTCWERVTGASSLQTSSEINIEVTVGAPDCTGLDSECYPYAFVELPRSDLPYTFTITEELPTCE